MNRRDLLKAMGLASSHVLFPSVMAGFLAGCSPSLQSLMFFSNSEFRVLTEIIDLIIPETKSASASQTNTQYFIDEVFATCMSEEQQKIIKAGISGFVDEFEASTDKLALIKELDQKAYQYQEDSLWFVAVKQYALIGFFTSQEGETKASNYVPAPGAYKGDIPADQNTLNYGETALRFYL